MEQEYVLLNYFFAFAALVIFFTVSYFWKKLLNNKKISDDIFIIIIAYLTILLPICIYSWQKQLLLLFSEIVLLGIIPNIFLGLFYYNRRGKSKDLYTNFVGITAEDIIENLPGHVYWKNSNGVCLGCNRNQYIDLGLANKKNYIGKTDYELFTKKQADELTLVDKEILNTGKEVIVEEASKVANGAEALYLSYKVPMKNKTGEIVGILGFSSDITNAKKHEIEQKEFLENIISLVPGHVYWLDRNCVYMGCNDAQAKSAGLSSRHEIVGKKNKDLPWNYHTQIPEILDKVNMEVMETGTPQIIEEPATMLDGTKGTFLSNKVPLRNKLGEIIGLLGISIDITNLKSLQTAKEKAETADYLKTQFILNIQHDIRTPFNGIRGCSAFLLEKETDPKKIKFLQAIANSAKELLEYCNYILDLSQIENNTSPVSEKRFNLYDLITKAVAIEKPVAEIKQLNLDIIYPENMQREFYGDDFRIYRIIINLLSNACKFTAQGSVSIEVKEAKKENDRNVFIKIIVKDTGEGIPQDMQKIIFEKFARGTLSNKGVHKGTGLGLYIVRHFIEELGGDLDLQSIVGQGTIFTCTVPFKLPLINKE